ncbi:MAG: hypothetical protein K0S39_5574 [Paenibacillus sp.]|jgi:hypothetical protein|nr:hypothetical protein [Paenibacillus sp.]
MQIVETPVETSFLSIGVPLCGGAASVLYCAVSELSLVSHHTWHRRSVFFSLPELGLVFSKNCIILNTKRRRTFPYTPRVEAGRFLLELKGDT